MLRATPAAQDYLKALYLEVERHEHPPEGRLVSTTAISQRLEVSAASATSMLKKLDSLGLVHHAPYRGARLSELGRSVALEVIRHHRLLETYLAEALGVPWDEVHDEAEILEHVLSEDLEERIAAHLGHPRIDPHGHPIPGKDLAMPQTSQTRLWDAAEGHRVVVERVSDANPAGLRYLAGLGIKPGVKLEVTGRGPIGGPLLVRLAEGRPGHALSKDMAESIWVS